LHVHRRPQVVGDLVHLAVVFGAVVKPRAEHRVARAGELHHGILRERVSRFFLHHFLIAGNHFLQVRGGQLGVQFGLGFFLLSIEDRFEIVLGNFQHHAAIHLDEAPVAIVSEARILALGFQRLHGYVVQPQIENRVHHARHGELGARAHADQQAVGGGAQFLSHAFFEQTQGFVHLLVHLDGNLVLVREVDIADLRGDGEARRHGQLGARHFRQSRALAAENVFHLSVAVSRSVAERVDILWHA
jgi:hypothetical protein